MALQQAIKDLQRDHTFSYDEIETGRIPAENNDHTIERDTSTNNNPLKEQLSLQSIARDPHHPYRRHMAELGTEICTRCLEEEEHCACPTAHSGRDALPKEELETLYHEHRRIEYHEREIAEKSHRSPKRKKLNLLGRYLLLLTVGYGHHTNPNSNHNWQNTRNTYQNQELNLRRPELPYHKRKTEPSINHQTRE